MHPLSVVAAVLLAHAGGFGPFASRGHPVTADARFARASAPPAEPETFFRLSFDFYQAVVSPIDGPACSHRPTCSLYGLKAVRRHGLVGMWLTVDRLWRGGESSALRLLPAIHISDRDYFADPLEESTFWLRTLSF